MALLISVVAREEEQVKRVIEGVWCPMDASSRRRKGRTPRTKVIYYDVVNTNTRIRGVVGPWMSVDTSPRV